MMPVYDRARNLLFDGVNLFPLLVAGESHVHPALPARDSTSLPHNALRRFYLRIFHLNIM